MLNLLRSYICIAVCVVFISLSEAMFQYSKDGVGLKERKKPPHLAKIPKHFEVDTTNQFEKYTNEIEKLARKRNLSVHYDIAVQTSPSEKRKGRLFGKGKRYSVPLKIRNSKLSSFEMLMKRRPEIKKVEPPPTTTVYSPPAFSSKRWPLGKYKPVISKLKTNYQKQVKPVKVKVITL